MFVILYGMTNEEILELNRKSVFSHKFLLELDGINTKVVKETSMPKLYKQQNSFSSHELSAIFYYNAAPEIAEWFSSGKKKNGKITILDNNDNPFFVFDLNNCEITEVDFGHGDYQSQEFLTVSINFKAEVSLKTVE